MNRYLCASLLSLPLLAFATAASAKSLVVDPDGKATAANCTATAVTPYTTINAALAAAVAGDSITVCPAVYSEQLKITKRVTLLGKNGATLRPSPMVVNSSSLFSGALAAAVIVVDGATANGTVIDQITVDGGAYGLESLGCGVQLVGVYYRNASGTVRNSVSKNIRLGAGLHGCQSGQGIFVQSGGGGSANVLINANSMHDFDKNGITGTEVGTNVTITNNLVSGVGPTPDTAQNGIEVASGAVGTVTNNRVTDVDYSLCTLAADLCYAASGIIVCGNSNSVTNNLINETPIGIYVDPTCGGSGNVTPVSGSGSNTLQNVPLPIGPVAPVFGFATFAKAPASSARGSVSVLR